MRSTFDLFAIVKQIVDANAQFRSLAEPWADTGTSASGSQQTLCWSGMDSNLQFRARWATVSWVRPSWGRSPVHRSSEQLQVGCADRLLEIIDPARRAHGRHATPK
jgi:hypothetical protein